ncbi:MAG: thioredoxin domain-containing protein [Armatimonadota bacterium]
MKARFRIALEVFAYVSFACLLALGLSAWLKLRDPQSQQSASVVHNKLDATILITALKLPVGSPAVIEFMDFQCPPCSASYPMLKKIMAQCPSVTYKEVNFPLPMHPYAFGAAVASEIARDGGQHDLVFNDLFGGSVNLDTQSLNQYLSLHHLPANVGKASSKDQESRVTDDINLGKSLKINATPTIMVVSRDGTLTEIRDLKLIPNLVR